MILMCLLLLLGSGCTGKKKKTDNDGAVYVEKLKNFEVREKNINNTAVNIAGTTSKRSPITSRIFLFLNISLKSISAICAPKRNITTAVTAFDI